MILDKAKMAHEWAMKYGKVDSNYNRENTVQLAWQYADAMQAEADKREPSGFPNVLRGACGEIVAVKVDDKEWQPDWSQAPEWAEYWVKNINGVFSWYSKKPTAFAQGWFVGAGAVYRVCPAPSFNYQGNWQDSLRKRPQ